MKNVWKNKRAIKAQNINTKRTDYQNNVDKIINRIKIKVIENPIELAIENFNKKNYQFKISKKTNESLLYKIIYGYIRHELSNYDRILTSFGPSCYYRFNIKFETNKKIRDKYKFSYMPTED